MFREDVSALAGQAHGQKLRAKFVGPTSRLFSPPPGGLPPSVLQRPPPALPVCRGGRLPVLPLVDSI